MQPERAISALDALLFADPTATPDAVADKILDAAFEQFRMLGIRRSSMEDIAKRAGVGRVTVYRRFESKDRLVQALLLRECRRSVQRVDERAAAHDTVEERMVEGFVAAMEEVRTHPLLLALLRTEPETVLPLLTVKAGLGLSIGRTYVAQKIREGRAELGLPDDDVDSVAEIFARLCLSMLLTPKTQMTIDTAEGARELARKHILPLALR